MCNSVAAETDGRILLSERMPRAMFAFRLFRRLGKFSRSLMLYDVTFTFARRLVISKESRDRYYVCELWGKLSFSLANYFVINFVTNVFRCIGKN